MSVASRSTDATRRHSGTSCIRGHAPSLNSDPVLPVIAIWGRSHQLRAHGSTPRCVVHSQKGERKTVRARGETCVRGGLSQTRAATTQAGSRRLSAWLASPARRNRLSCHAADCTSRYRTRPAAAPLRSRPNRVHARARSVRTECARCAPAPPLVVRRGVHRKRGGQEEERAG